MVVEVACGVIVNENKVLCVQRSEIMSLPLKWEFPGGKVEKNETAEDCIIREIFEELNLEIKPMRRLNENIFKYAEDKVIKLIPFVCEILNGEIKLTEHVYYLWLDQDELLSLDWAEADLPILKELLNIQLWTKEFMNH